MTLTIQSTAFSPLGPIPRKHTCDGENVSPPLQWSGAPERTRGFALIVDDPDAPDPSAPQRVFVHWVVYDLPRTSAGLPEGTTAEMLPAGAREGTNDWQRTGYGGPCPPKGRHRYFFRLYALGTLLGDLRAPSKAALEAAMSDHVLATAELVGTYERARRGGA
ncbi:MAG: YbhB/YbcL family Raf kinase inhibitor-like protein [Actinomycetota bacterium]|nr:YbhB/YbcL family Raf kinase inhibitor-like protein [Actinomycetota bacterium]